MCAGDVDLRPRNDEQRLAPDDADRRAGVDGEGLDRQHRDRRVVERDRQAGREDAGAVGQRAAARRGVVAVLPGGQRQRRLRRAERARLEQLGVPQRTRRRRVGGVDRVDRLDDPEDAAATDRGEREDPHRPHAPQGRAAGEAGSIRIMVVDR
jgi:hypothetical protein